MVDDKWVTAIWAACLTLGVCAFSTLTLICLPSVLTLCVRLRLSMLTSSKTFTSVVDSFAQFRIHQSLDSIILLVATCYTSPSKPCSEGTFGSRPDQILFARGHVLHVICKTNPQIHITNLSFDQPTLIVITSFSGLLIRLKSFWEQFFIFVESDVK